LLFAFENLIKITRLECVAGYRSAHAIIPLLTIARALMLSTVVFLGNYYYDTNKAWVK
jgi:hypothetical protein